MPDAASNADGALVVAVRSALASVLDPEIRKPITELDMVGDVAVDADGRASVAVGVTDDLAAHVSAVDLVKAAVATLGGQGGGGRADMAQGGGPDGAKAKDALDAVKDALEKVAA